MAELLTAPNKMDRNAIENYNKIKADAEAVLAAAGYTPDKMMWECWRGLENPAAKKVLTDAADGTPSLLE